MVNYGRVIEVAHGYAVCESGVVLSRRPVNGKGDLVKDWRIVKSLPCSGGRYMQVGIDGSKLLVHRLVATAFHGPCPEDMEVAHINGDSHDNRPSNLVYATHRENEAMKKWHGTSTSGEKNGMARLTCGQVEDIRSRPVERGNGGRIAKEFGVSEATISFIRSGKRWGDQVERFNP